VDSFPIQGFQQEVIMLIRGSFMNSMGYFLES